MGSRPPFLFLRPSVSVAGLHAVWMLWPLLHGTGDGLQVVNCPNFSTRELTLAVFLLLLSCIGHALAESDAPRVKEEADQKHGYPSFLYDNFVRTASYSVTFEAAASEFAKSAGHACEVGRRLAANAIKAEVVYFPGMGAGSEIDAHWSAVYSDAGAYVEAETAARTVAEIGETAAMASQLLIVGAMSLNFDYQPYEFSGDCCEFAVLSSNACRAHHVAIDAYFQVDRSFKLARILAARAAMEEADVYDADYENRRAVVKAAIEDADGELSNASPDQSVISFAEAICAAAVSAELTEIAAAQVWDAVEGSIGALFEKSVFDEMRRPLPIDCRDGTSGCHPVYVDC